MADGPATYYVRTVAGSFRDDRSEFTTKWQKVEAGDLSASHFNNPKLEIVTAEEHDKAKKHDEERGLTEAPRRR